MSAVPRIACAALLLAAFTPAPAGAQTCYIQTSTYGVLEIGDNFYMQGSVNELWEETNGIDGLQRRDSGCSNGSVIPSDSCLWRASPDGVLNCSADFVLDQLGV